MVEFSHFANVSLSEAHETGKSSDIQTADFAREARVMVTEGADQYWAQSHDYLTQSVLGHAVECSRAANWFVWLAVLRNCGLLVGARTRSCGSATEVSDFGFLPASHCILDDTTTHP